MSPRRAVAAALAAAVLAACSQDGAGPAGRDTPAAPAAETNPSRTVALPDLSRLEPGVHARVRSAYLEVQRRTDPDAPAAAGERADAWGALGKLLLASEHVAVAEDCFVNAAALAPQDVRWPYLAGQARRLQHDPDGAAAHFARAVALEPHNVPALLWLADMHLALNRIDAAEDALARAAALAPDTAALHDARGRAALARRDFPAAAAHLEKALAAAPDATRLHYRLGLAYRGTGDRARAEAHLQRRGDVDVARADPLMAEVSGLLQNAAAYEIRAARALEERRWADAVTDLRKAAELSPATAVVRMNLGNALYQTGDTRGAIEQLRSAVRLDPTLARGHYALGVLMEIEGNDPEAIAALSAAVAADPGHAEARLALAEALRREGRVEAALPHYAAVTRAHPEISQAAFGHAIAHVRLGRYREARALLEDGMHAYPDQPGFAHALARLLAAAPDASVRDGSRALMLIADLSRSQTSVTLAETMAMALAEAGRFEEAIRWQRAAMAEARAGRPDLLPAMTRNLASYERRQPCRTPWADDDPIHRPRIGR